MNIYSTFLFVFVSGKKKEGYILRDSDKRGWYGFYTDLRWEKVIVLPLITSIKIISSF